VYNCLDDESALLIFLNEGWDKYFLIKLTL